MCKNSPCMGCEQRSIGCHDKCNEYGKYKAILYKESEERIERIRTWYPSKGEARLCGHRNTFNIGKREVVIHLLPTNRY